MFYPTTNQETPMLRCAVLYEHAQLHDLAWCAPTSSASSTATGYCNCLSKGWVCFLKLAPDNCFRNRNHFSSYDEISCLYNPTYQSVPQQVLSASHPTAYLPKSS
jgi:hypothetical protein